MHTIITKAESRIVEFSSTLLKKVSPEEHTVMACVLMSREVFGVRGMFSCRIIRSTNSRTGGVVPELYASPRRVKLTSKFSFPLL